VRYGLICVGGLDGAGSAGSGSLAVGLTAGADGRAFLFVEGINVGGWLVDLTARKRDESASTR
jgi:hypothetical protein